MPLGGLKSNDKKTMDLAAALGDLEDFESLSDAHVLQLKERVRSVLLLLVSGEEAKRPLVPRGDEMLLSVQEQANPASYWVTVAEKTAQGEHTALYKMDVNAQTGSVGVVFACSDTSEDARRAKGECLLRPLPLRFRALDTDWELAADPTTAKTAEDDKQQQGEGQALLLLTEIDATSGQRRGAPRAVAVSYPASQLYSSHRYLAFLEASSIQHDRLMRMPRYDDAQLGTVALMLEHGAWGMNLVPARLDVRGARLVCGTHCNLDYPVGTAAKSSADGTEVLVFLERDEPDLSLVYRAATEPAAVPFNFDTCHGARSRWCAMGFAQDYADIDLEHAKTVLDPEATQRHHQATSAGSECTRRGDFLEARAHYERAVADKPDDVESLYNLGCCCARVGDPSAALDHLAKAAHWGFRDWAHAYHDEDWESVRNLPAFVEILQSMHRCNPSGASHSALSSPPTRQQKDLALAGMGVTAI